MTDIYPIRYLESKPEDETEWLAKRWENSKGEARITASVAGVVHGQHQFKSVADLYNELTADNATLPDGGNEDTEAGNEMEPFVRGVAEVQHGIELHVPTEMYAYEEPGVRLMATVDAVNYANNDMRVFELKTWRGYWKETLKPGWYWQGIHIAICCDVPQIEWAILDAQTRVHHHIQVVTSDEKQIHIDACRKFLGYIDAGMTPPDAVFTYDHIKDRYPQGDGSKTVELDESVMATFERLALAKEQIRQGQEVEDLLKAELGALLGDAEYGELGGHLLISWKTSSRTSFDQKQFEKEHPALYERFKKTVPVRTMRILLKGDE